MSRRSTTPEPATPAESRASQNSIAGIGGAGGGTLMLTFANAVDPHSLWHGVLLYASPSFAVISGALILLIKVQTESMVQGRYIKKARETLVRQRNDPSTTEEYRKEIDDQLMQLNRTEISSHMARVKALAIVNR